MSKRSDPALKAAKLQASVARVLGVEEANLFPPHTTMTAAGVPNPSQSESEENRNAAQPTAPTACLCLLNVGPAGFLAIDYDTFSDIVQASFGDTVAASWMPHARSFSFVLFDSPALAQQAYQRFHLRPCPQLPGGHRLGLAAFADPTFLPGLPASFQAALGLDMEQGHVPPGLTFQPEFLSEAEEQELLSFIHGLPASDWIPVHGRRVVHFGASFEYSTFSVGPAPPFPAALSQFHDRLRPYLGGKLPHQATISIYPQGKGIPPHIDIPELGAYIVSVSLYSGCAMDFRIPHGDPVHSVYLPPRSLLALRDEARFKYAHGIKERTSDEVEGVVVPRKEVRVSIVWRAL